MNAIVDYSQYRKEMEKGLKDKLFFMDKIEFSNILDYGCADGVLIEAMSNYYPEKKYVGYDFNPEMINFAKSRNIYNANFYTNLKNANENLKVNKGNSVVLCSSLIHEVYSYGNAEDIEVFWNTIYSGNYEYVVIRDMALDQNMLNKDIKTSLKELTNLRRYGNKKQIEEFESIWGSLENKKNAIHFLLKYRYTKNWNREVRENYLPISIQEHLIRIPKQFSLVYFEHFILPFNQEIIKKDFDIELKDSTHIKLIVKCK